MNKIRMHQDIKIKFTMSKRQASVYFLTIPLLSVLLYSIGYATIPVNSWAAYFLIITSILLLILLLYSLFFLLKYGLPYVQISPTSIQSRAFIKNKTIQIESIEETSFNLQKINRFTTIMDLVIYQKSDPQKIALNGHHIRKEVKLPLSFLPVQSRFDALNFLSFIYYTDESKREKLIEEYNQTQNFEFEHYLDSRIIILLHHFGFLTILPEQELQDTVRLIEEEILNSTLHHK